MTIPITRVLQELGVKEMELALLKEKTALLEQKVVLLERAVNHKSVVGKQEQVNP